MVVRNFRTTTQHGAFVGKTQSRDVKLYNLDVIISVGYRVKSKQGTLLSLISWLSRQKHFHISNQFPIFTSLLYKEAIKTFYNGLQADSTLLDRLLIFKISPADVIAGLALIAETEAARSAYLIEVGESQNATKTKNSAFEAIDIWMRDFYAVAKIALEDSPQLLEAVSLFVRS